MPKIIKPNPKKGRKLFASKGFSIFSSVKGIAVGAGVSDISSGEGDGETSGEGVNMSKTEGVGVICGLGLYSVAVGVGEGVGLDAKTTVIVWLLYVGVNWTLGTAP